MPPLIRLAVSFAEGVHGRAPVREVVRFRAVSEDARDRLLDADARLERDHAAGSRPLTDAGRASTTRRSARRAAVSESCVDEVHGGFAPA